MLHAGFGIIKIIRNAIVNKVNLRRRAKKLLAWLRFFSKFVGKIMRIIKRKKYFKGIRVISTQILRIYLVPYVRLWVKQRRKRMKKIIMSVIEKKLSQCMLIALIDKWLKRVEIIQRHLKFGLFYRASLYESLILKWNHAEYDMYNLTPAHARRRTRHTISYKKIQEQARDEGCTSIPIDVKLFYIRTYIHRRMMLYMIEYRSYLSHFNLIHQQHLQNRWGIQNEGIIEYPIPPTKPMLYSEFNSSRLQELIQKALQDRTEWPIILTSQSLLASRTLRKRITNFGHK